MNFRHTCLLLASASILAAGLGVAYAAEADKPAQPTASTVKLELSVAEAQLAGVAFGNAGTACDAGVQVYCQVLQLRGSLVGKLSDGLRAAQAQPPKAPAK